jgi:hypothetical protein
LAGLEGKSTDYMLMKFDTFAVEDELDHPYKAPDQTLQQQDCRE